MEQLDSSTGVSPKSDDDQIAAQIKSLEERVAVLTEANLRLIAIQEEHRDSLSHLAHELRTPLTSILGFSEILLSQEELTDIQRNFIKRIQNSAHQLQNALNQLSTLYRTQRVSADGSQNRER